MCSNNVLKKLCFAIKINNIKRVRGVLNRNPEIIQASTISSNNDDRLQITRVTPMWEAMLGGFEKIVKLLIKFGANPNEPFSFDKNQFFGLTFLQCLAMQNYFWVNKKKVAKILIRRGGISNAGNEKTPLQISIEQGNLQFAKFLLRNGSRLRDKVKNISSAPKNKQKKLLELLIKSNCLCIDVHSPNHNQNYLHMAIAYAVHHPELDIDIVGIAETFLNHGLPVNDLDKDGESVLFYAIDLQNFDLLYLLVDRGADVNHKNSTGAFPLYLAANRHNIKLLKLLFFKGADANATTDGGNTALHIACFKRNEKIINLMIQKGANTSVKNKRGKTPFSILKPEKFRDSDVKCINAMVKGLAKQIFFNDFTLCNEDMDLILAHPIVSQFFQTCTQELTQMASIKFYRPYSYASVLQMSKNIKKLANLAKNIEFVTNLEAGLHNFPCYADMLEKIWKEAIRIRNHLSIVESRLKDAFGDVCPDVVLRKLANNLYLDDLPIE